MEHPSSNRQEAPEITKADRSVGTALLAEIRRVRDEVMPAYIEIGPSGAFALANMRADMDAAINSLVYPDAVQAIGCLAKLRGYTT